MTLQTVLRGLDGTRTARMALMLFALAVLSLGLIPIGVSTAGHSTTAADCTASLADCARAMF